MPYRIDFVHGRGHEMTLDKEGGIGRGDLDELEINMLKSQRVPCLLPVEWMEMDGRVSFRYALSGKKMLLHRLQQEPLTMQQFYGMLLRVASALLECRDYLLRPEGCLLGDSFLFVGDHLEDLSFVYVPLISRKAESDQGDDLLSLVARWTAYVDSVDGEGLRGILQLFHANRWPLAELRGLMIEKLGKQRSHSPDTESVMFDERPSSSPVDLAERVQPVNPAQIQPDSNRIDNYPNEEADRRGISRSSNMEPAIGFADGEEGEPNARRGKSRWMAGAAFVLGAACIWRFVYLGQPSSQTALISAGLTLLLLAGTILLWRKGGELLIASPSPGLEAPAFAGSFELQSGPLPMKQRWRMQSEYSGSEDLSERGGATTHSMGNYALPPAERDPESDNVLPISAVSRPASEPTTLLSNFPDGPPTGSANAKLGRSWNGHEEEIPILSDVFQIGRVNAGSGYEEKADGVSRLHLEIAREQGGHVAKDLGSRNGSLYNGTLMIPYKAYPLSPGDVIQLAGAKGPSYRFNIN